MGRRDLLHAPTCTSWRKDMQIVRDISRKCIQMGRTMSFAIVPSQRWWRGLFHCGDDDVASPVAGIIPSRSDDVASPVVRFIPSRSDDVAPNFAGFFFARLLTWLLCREVYFFVQWWCGTSCHGIFLREAADVAFFLTAFFVYLVCRNECLQSNYLWLPRISRQYTVASHYPFFMARPRSTWIENLPWASMAISPSQPLSHTHPSKWVEERSVD